jgi:hypothetical protein
LRGWSHTAAHPHQQRHPGSIGSHRHTLADPGVHSDADAWRLPFAGGRGVNQGYRAIDSSHWSADQAYSTGSYGRLESNPSYSSSSPVDLAFDPVVYQSFRQGPVLDYQADVPNGSYLLVLHFSEAVARQSGQRSMQVVLDGVTQTPSVDIYAAVQANRALRLSYPVTVTTGQLHFTLQALAGRAELAAYEVLGVAPGLTPTQTPVTDPLSVELLQPAGAILLPTPQP